ncbi:MAG TPA: hypothetical protein H9987_13760 [Candidatus Luteococcus avicola]|nr:hypothetical protein [Candidatus Luteococcus avicola]
MWETLRALLSEVKGLAGNWMPAGHRSPTSTRLADRDAAPLRFAYGPADRERVTHHLVSDAWRAIPASTTSAHPDARPAAGTVMGIIGGRAMVRLDDGPVATIWPEALVGDVTAA